MSKRWNTISKIPPDELLEVKDKEGNTAFAYPTYYPFKTTKLPGMRKWKMEVIHQPPTWDGGWMIKLNGMKMTNIGNITHWRKL